MFSSSINRQIISSWTLAQAVNRTSGRSGSASEDDPAERGCSRSRTTLGSTPTTPGGSQVLEGATTRGRSSVPLTDWLTDWLIFNPKGWPLSWDLGSVSLLECEWVGRISPYGHLFVFCSQRKSEENIALVVVVLTITKHFNANIVQKIWKYTKESQQIY